MLMRKKLSTEERSYCGKLYSKYRRYMYSIAVQYASSEATADDIVQNASFAMAKYSHRFRELDEPARLTYVRLIVQSAASNHYRSIRHDERLLLRTEPNDICCAPSAEADYMDFANSELLEKALNSLDERDKLLLTGKFYLRLSDAELAEMVGCKPDSIRTLVMRAKKKAQKKLIEEGFKHDEI